MTVSFSTVLWACASRASEVSVLIWYCLDWDRGRTPWRAGILLFHLCWCASPPVSAGTSPLLVLLPLLSITVAGIAAAAAAAAAADVVVGPPGGDR